MTIPTRFGYIVAALFISASIGAAPSETQPDNNATELEPLVVTPPYLYEGDRQLNRLSKSLPDLGGDAPASGVIAELRKFYEKRKDPNDLDPFSQDMLLRALGEKDDF